MSVPSDCRLGHNYVRHAPLDAEYGDLESTRPDHLKDK